MNLYHERRWRVPFRPIHGTRQVPHLLSRTQTCSVIRVSVLGYRATWTNEPGHAFGVERLLDGSTSSPHHGGVNTGLFQDGTTQSSTTERE